MLTRLWYRKSFHIMTFLLWPFAMLYGVCITVRRLLYRLGIMTSYHFDMPIIIVGNIVVGGTGKTPFVIWLADFLRKKGYQPGIVSRGVSGIRYLKPHRVQEIDTAQTVGDEALLLHQKTACPVVVCINRPAGVKHLINDCACNIVISDDGLQHYRLQRDIEIVMIDSERGLGNRLLLPAGPLREKASRLFSVDFIILNGAQHETDQANVFNMSLIPSHGVCIKNKQKKLLAAFKHKKVHAVAGIGHPERFFKMLLNAGFDIIPHAFSDHYHYQAYDLDFKDDYPVFMTEKDAVKCVSFAKENYWYVPVSVAMAYGFEKKLLTKLGETKCN